MWGFIYRLKSSRTELFKKHLVNLWECGHQVCLSHYFNARLKVLAVEFMSLTPGQLHYPKYVTVERNIRNTSDKECMNVRAEC